MHADVDVLGEQPGEGEGCRRGCRNARGGAWALFVAVLAVALYHAAHDEVRRALLGPPAAEERADAEREPVAPPSMERDRATANADGAPASPR